jgi:hypothetical protein
MHYYIGNVIFKPERPPDQNLQIDLLWYQSSPGKDISTKAKKPRPLTHVMLQKMVEDGKRQSLIVGKILEYYRDPLRNILVLTKRLEQMDLIIHELKRNSVPDCDIGLLRGDVPEKERVENQKRRIVFAIEKLGKEGLDAVHLNTMIFGLPLGDTEQAIGRIQRCVETREEDGGVYVAPTVVYIVDPYSIYIGMAMKHLKYWKTMGYRINRIQV